MSSQPEKDPHIHNFACNNLFSFIRWPANIQWSKVIHEKTTHYHGQIQVNYHLKQQYN